MDRRGYPGSTGQDVLGGDERLVVKACEEVDSDMPPTVFEALVPASAEKSINKAGRLRAWKAQNVPDLGDASSLGNSAVFSNAVLDVLPGVRLVGQQVFLEVDDEVVFGVHGEGSLEEYGCVRLCEMKKLILIP